MSHARSNEVMSLAESTVNMEVSIGPGGQTLYISRARFAGGTAVPRESDLLIAHRAGARFMLDSRSGELLARVNTPDLTMLNAEC